MADTYPNSQPLQGEPSIPKKPSSEGPYPLQASKSHLFPTGPIPKDSMMQKEDLSASCVLNTGT